MGSLSATYLGKIYKNINESFNAQEKFKITG